jgi:NADH-quinone oxidoreductase subunit E
MNELKVDDVLADYQDAGRDSLIAILQKVQDVEGYLSEASVVAVGETLGLPASKIYGVATFYNQFRFSPLGRFHIQVCRGTACHVKGSASVMQKIKQELKIDADETSRDGMFSLEVVACIGACGLAPVISVNGKIHAGISADAVPAILEGCRTTAAGENN